MPELLPVAIVGVGRMGWVHATHLWRLEQAGMCRLAAIVDCDTAKVERFKERSGCRAQTMSSVEELAASGVCRTTVVVTPTALHRAHTAVLVRAGHRVLLEKPLTGTLAGDQEFCEELERDYPVSVMLAFQRRFDAALIYARELMDSDVVGKVFKIYSALEDSGPAPNGYQSDGILPDMSVHNVDEILWLTGRTPDRALAVGSRIYSHALTTCQEDFDDAMLYLWFGDDLLGQVQVSRNHVSGYRVETIIFGQMGQIQIGRFDQRPAEVVVEAFGRRGSLEPLARRVFPGGKGGPGAPEFVDRFGPAYKREVEVFLERCREGSAFPTSHWDGLRAQEVIAAGMRALRTSSDGFALAELERAAASNHSRM
ncbi:MAG TPA: Gfo/Idh/MocA family oxidoreductase [Bryobacteraceae bacterium]|nr:Gfo/Idh/MocA family oxidoreductase [Bryobacteraceae bacterium]